MNTSIVNHVTRVTINLAAFMTMNMDIQSDFSSNQIRILGSDVNNRLQKLADVLEQLSTIGFSLSWEKGILSAYSRENSASETKKLLIEHGLKDRDFSIYLEYERGWGMM